MLTIDGKEGGGQLLRSSLSLSAVTQTPFKITGIRGAREKGGLAHQHLTAVKAMQDLTNAKVEGMQLGSNELTFIPSKIKGGKFRIDIGTAGSTTLLLQTLIPACLHEEIPSELEVTGGTDTQWALPSLYFKNIFCYFLKKIGIDLEVEIKKHGFYPKGQGNIVLKIKPCKKIREFEFVERGSLKGIEVLVYGSESLRNKNVAEKMLSSFKDNFKEDFKSEIRYVPTASESCFIHATASYEKTRLGHTALLMDNEQPETSGERCAKTLKEEMESNAVVDRFAADQLMLYMALAGNSKILTSKIRNHVLTNSQVIEKFLPVKFSIKNSLISCQKL